MNEKAKYNLTAILATALVLEIMFWIAFGMVYFVLLKVLPGLRWEKPDLAWLFLTGPLVFILFIGSVWIKNYRLQKFSDYRLLHTILPDISSVNITIKYVLWRLAVVFLVLALMNPKLGTKTTEAKIKGIDLILAVDVSNSMLAEDIKPNRITRATRAIEKMLERLHGDRIGIVVFAGQSFVQLPITSDYSAGKLFLSSIKTDMVPVQGTAIGSAIDLALKSFDFESPAQKAIVIITDGENHEDDAVASAKTAREKGVKVYTIGLGSPDGTPIPNFVRGRRDGFMKDKDGNTVITRLNEDMLREIAQAGDGNYIRGSTAEVGLNTLLDDLNSLEKADIGTVVYAEYEDRFQPFLALSLIFILFEFMIRDRKGILSQQVNLFN